MDLRERRIGLVHAASDEVLGQEMFDRFKDHFGDDEVAIWQQGHQPVRYQDAAHQFRAALRFLT